LKIFLIGDVHHKITQFQLGCNFLEWVNHKISELKPDIVVNVGDHFDNHSILRSEIMTEYRKHVDHVLREKIAYFHIVGNHELYKPKDKKYHALQCMKGLHPDYQIIDVDEGFDNVSLIPFYPDYSLFPKKLKDVCITHNQFLGADFGYKKADDGIDSKTIDTHVILSGHVHMRHEFGKVVYVGTPYSKGLDDIDQTKGVTVFDTETYQRTFIETPFPRWIGKKYEISSDYTVQDLYLELKNTVNDKDHWIVQLTGPKAELVEFIASKEYKELNADVHVKTNFTDKDKKKVQISAVGMENIIKEYVEKVYDGSLDKNEITSGAVRVLNTVRSQVNKVQI
jgi:hypothetical protein